MIKKIFNQIIKYKNYNFSFNALHFQFINSLYLSSFMISQHKNVNFIYNTRDGRKLTFLIIERGPKLSCINNQILKRLKIL